MEDCAWYNQPDHDTQQRRLRFHLTAEMQAPPRFMYGHVEYRVGFIFTVAVLREDIILR